MSAMLIPAILGAVVINNTTGNNHYSDEPTYAHDYNDLPTH
jgi:hypothetical protein